jgi:hypothetical protein
MGLKRFCSALAKWDNCPFLPAASYKNPLPVKSHKNATLRHPEGIFKETFINLFLILLCSVGETVAKIASCWSCWSVNLLSSILIF